jgi:hypothetical protein
MKRCKCGELTTYSQNGVCDLCCAKERTAYEQKKIAEAVAVARADALEEAAAIVEQMAEGDRESRIIAIAIRSRATKAGGVREP